MQVFTITDAAKILGCSVRTVQRRLDAGEFEAVHEHGKRLVRLTAGVSGDMADNDTTGDKRAARGATDAETVEAEAISSDATGDRIGASLDSDALNYDTPHDMRKPARRDTALAIPESNMLALLADVVTRRIREEQADEQAKRAKEKPAPSEVSHKLLLTLDECSILTGLSRATLRAAIENGALNARVIGRGFKVTRVNLEAFVRTLG